MKEHPISFNGPMIQAIQAGLKTQMRRVVLPQPTPFGKSSYGGNRKGWECKKRLVRWNDDDKDPYQSIDQKKRLANMALSERSPYGKPGDRLWVQEAWRPVGLYPDSERLLGMVEYRSASEISSWRDITQDEFNKVNLRVARETKQPEDTFCCRLTNGPNPLCKMRHPNSMPRWASRINLEITDIRVEQLQDITEGDAKAEGVDGTGLAAGVLFYELWQSIYGDDHVKGWEANPWVWVVEFRRIES